MGFRNQSLADQFQRLTLHRVAVLGPNRLCVRCPSTSCDCKSCGENVLGCIHIRVSCMSTRDTDKDRLALAVLGPDISAVRTGLGSVLGIYRNYHCSRCDCFVFDALSKSVDESGPNNSMNATVVLSEQQMRLIMRANAFARSCSSAVWANWSESHAAERTSRFE